MGILWTCGLVDLWILWSLWTLWSATSVFIIYLYNTTIIQIYDNNTCSSPRILWTCGSCGACGLVDLWTCGLVDLWTCGLVDLWTCGPCGAPQVFLLYICIIQQLYKYMITTLVALHGSGGACGSCGACGPCGEW